MKTVFSYLLFFLFLSLSLRAESLDQFLSLKLSAFSRYEYEIVSTPLGLKDRHDILPDSSSSLELNRSYAYLRTSCLLHGVKSDAVITLRLKLYKIVPVAKNDIKKGSTLCPGEFFYREEEVSKIQSPFAGDSSGLPYLRARLPISKGSVLREDMIELMPIIKRGQEVRVIADYGTVMVSFKAKTREEGFPGGRVMVKREDGRLFRTQVIDSTTVKIQD